MINMGMKQRDLKFRAWYNDKMYYGIEKHHFEHHSMSGMGGDVWDFSDWIKYSKVMQYTGVKDKNGNEIYEGDILNCTYEGINDFIRKVLWWSDTFSIGWTPSGPLTGMGTMEIIGNIFENKDLI